MKNVIDEFRELLVINKDNLDSVCSQQSELFYKVAEAYSEAVSKRDKDKEDVTISDAQISTSFREEAEKSGAKITEASLQQKVLTSQEHFEAMSTYLDSKLIVENLSGLKTAFEQRVSMITNLCKLYCAGYFGDPEVKDRKNVDEVKMISSRRRMMSKLKG